METVSHRSLPTGLGNPDFPKAAGLHGLAGSCFLAFLTPLRGYKLGHLDSAEDRLSGHMT